MAATAGRNRIGVISPREATQQTAAEGVLSYM